MFLHWSSRIHSTLRQISCTQQQISCSYEIFVKMQVIKGVGANANENKKNN